MKKEREEMIEMRISLEECGIILENRKRKTRRFIKQMKRRERARKLAYLLRKKEALLPQKACGATFIALGTGLAKYALPLCDGELTFTALFLAMTGIGLCLSKVDLRYCPEE